jgi:hypothetical protein
MLHGQGRTDGQTDMRKLIVAFSNFGKASKKNLSASGNSKLV